MRIYVDFFAFSVLAKLMGSIRTTEILWIRTTVLVDKAIKNYFPANLQPVFHSMAWSLIYFFTTLKRKLCYTLCEK